MLALQRCMSFLHNLCWLLQCWEYQGAQWQQETAAAASCWTLTMKNRPDQTVLDNNCRDNRHSSLVGGTADGVTKWTIHGNKWPFLCLLQDTSQLRKPIWPSPVVCFTTSLRCHNTQVDSWCHPLLGWTAGTSWLTCFFLYIQHSGLLLHPRGITGKRERESERDSCGEKDGVACSVNKMQRQSTEVRLLFFTVIFHTFDI